MIDRIYDGALDAGAWSKVLATLADDFHAIGGILVSTDAERQTARVLASANLDPGYLSSYSAHYVTVDPWTAPFAALPLGTIAGTDQILPRAELVETEFYNDWLRPQGIACSLGGVIFEQGPRVVRLGIPRAEGQGPYVARDFERLRALAPHLARSVRLWNGVSRLGASRAAAEDALDLLPMGVFLVDRDCRVVHMNRVAAKIARARDGLTVGRGRLLSAARVVQTRALHRLVGAAALAAAGEGAGAGGASLPVDRPSGQRAYEVLVAPRPRPGGLPGLESPFAVIFVGDPERAVEVPAERLQRLYRLSPAEARLAREIAGGARLADVADRLGVSVNTARTHLQRALKKTGTGRQAELVSLVLKGPGGLR